MFGSTAANQDVFGRVSSGFDAAAADRPAVPRPRSRRVLSGLLSAAVCISTAVVTLGLAPAVIAMSDRQEIVRWCNWILDLVGQ